MRQRSGRRRLLGELGRADRRAIGQRRRGHTRAAAARWASCSPQQALHVAGPSRSPTSRSAWTSGCAGSAAAPAAAPACCCCCRSRSCAAAQLPRITHWRLRHSSCPWRRPMPNASATRATMQRRGACSGGARCRQCCPSARASIRATRPKCWGSPMITCPALSWFRRTAKCWPSTCLQVSGLGGLPAALARRGWVGEGSWMAEKPLPGMPKAPPVMPCTHCPHAAAGGEYLNSILVLEQEGSLGPARVYYSGVGPCRHAGIMWALCAWLPHLAWGRLRNQRRRPAACAALHPHARCATAPPVHSLLQVRAASTRTRAGTWAARRCPTAAMRRCGGAT